MYIRIYSVEGRFWIFFFFLNLEKRVCFVMIKTKNVYTVSIHAAGYKHSFFYPSLQLLTDFDSQFHNNNT